MAKTKEQIFSLGRLVSNAVAGFTFGAFGALGYYSIYHILFHQF